jgi:hypothetical protein
MPQPWNLSPIKRVAMPQPRNLSLIKRATMLQCGTFLTLRTIKIGIESTSVEIS